MSDQRLDDNGDLILFDDGDVVLGDNLIDGDCCPTYLCGDKCCFGEEITLTFDTLTDVWPPGDPTSTMTQWIVSNLSGVSVNAPITRTPLSTNGCGDYEWTIYSPVTDVDDTYAYYVRVRVTTGAGTVSISNPCPITMVLRVDGYRVLKGSYSIGDPITSTVGSVITVFLAGIGLARAAEFPTPPTGFTYGDCCTGDWGSSSVTLWSSAFITASTGANGITGYDTNSLESCPNECEGLDSCYQISGYSDGDLSPCTTCTNSLNTAWDGTFNRSPCDPMDLTLPEYCGWIVSGSTLSIAGKALDQNYTLLYRSCGIWYLQVVCSGAPNCIIWRGTKSTGTDPTGTYTYDCGVDTTATFDIEACPP